MPNEQVRWGLLSTARINERLIPPICASQRSELLAVASRSQDKAQRYAKQWKIPRAYGTYDELLADPEVDVVYISLPNGLHVEWSVKCADAGKHVLCEKPLAVSTEGIDRMAEAAQRNAVIIQEAAMMRFHPQTQYVQQLIASGAIGDVRLIRGIFGYLLSDPEDVRLAPDQGGGSLWDLGSYCVSFARTVLQDEPVEVLASETTSDRGVDLSLSGQMRFAKDIHVHFFSSLQSFAHVEADLLGSEGRMQLDFPWVNQLGRSGTVKLIRHDGSPRKSAWDDGMLNQTTQLQTYPDVNAYQDELDSMVTSIVDGTEPVITLTDSRKNVAAIVALLESARTGRAVVI